MADNNEIFDLITKMYSDLTNKIENIHSNLTNKIDGIHSEMQEMKSDIKQLKNDVVKNTIILEKMDTNIKLLAEGQEAFREQIGRANNEDNRTVNERLETIELAVKSTSKDIKVVKRRVENTEEDVIEIQSHLKIIK